MVTPSYVKLFEDGTLRQRAERANALLRACSLCPRACGGGGRENETGFCGTGQKACVAGVHPHFGEEVDDVQLAEMMLHLAAQGCHNINLVTPTHVIPQILNALLIAAEKGLSLPLVYNCGGYERAEVLQLLEGIVDIYMPDFKFWDSSWSTRYCAAEDYPEIARSALREMHRQRGDLRTDEQGVATSGLLVRHLVMPQGVAGTRELCRFLAEEISPATYLHIMG